MLSAPLWWAFEGINAFTQNWRYLGAEQYSSLEYALIASWHFSVVIPAVFEAAELVGSFEFTTRFRRGPAVRLPDSLLFASVVLGLISLAALAAWPQYVFPFAWLCLLLILDPINHVQGRPSVITCLGRGDWRTVFALATGALICGWFWEMWNYWAFPKWEYDIPSVDFVRILEMPLLGYGGYLPFGLEVYAGYYFLSGLFGWALKIPKHAVGLLPGIQHGQPQDSGGISSVGDRPRNAGRAETAAHY